MNLRRKRINKMHFLSQYQLTISESRKLKLYDSYSVHKAVFTLFEDARLGDRKKPSGVVYADKGMRGGRRTILILSDRKPKEPSVGGIAVRNLPDPYLGYSAYSFEIVINAVKRDSKTGKIIPIKGRQSIAEWFLKKSPSWGFSVPESSFMVAKIEVDRFQKSKSLVTLQKAKVTGLLEVEKHDIFVNSVYNGIGRGKAFGCGLLQIVPAY